MLRKNDNLFRDLVSYIQKDLVKEVAIWIKYLRYNFLLVFGTLAIIVGIIFYINPIPPKQAFLATGQMGSSYQAIWSILFWTGHRFNISRYDQSEWGSRKVTWYKVPSQRRFCYVRKCESEKFPRPCITWEHSVFPNLGFLSRGRSHQRQSDRSLWQAAH